MTKEIYTPLQMETVIFQAEDVITTSVPLPGDNVGH